MKDSSIQILSYIYPTTLRLLIRDTIYEYESSPYLIERFESKLRRDGRKGWKGFRSLNWFKKQSTLIGKETAK